MGSARRQPVASAPVTILLVDDHDLVRAGLRKLLEMEADFRILGEAKDGREAIALAETLDPDVVVMDIAMPEMNGIESTRILRKAAPRSRVLILSAHGELPYLERVASLGAIGFVLKHGPVSNLIKGIRAAHAGNVFVSPSLRRHLPSSFQTKRGAMAGDSGAALTSREAEVLQLVAEGEGNKGIAAKLGISIKTVEKHRQSLMKKLDLHDVAGVVRFALTAGIIDGGVQISSEQDRHGYINSEETR